MNGIPNPSDQQSGDVLYIKLFTNLVFSVLYCKLRILVYPLRFMAHVLPVRAINRWGKTLSVLCVARAIRLIRDMHSWSTKYSQKYPLVIFELNPLQLVFLSSYVLTMAACMFYYGGIY